MVPRHPRRGARGGLAIDWGCALRSTHGSAVVSTEADATGSAIPPCGCGSPGTADASVCYCGVEDLLRIIRRRYSLAVMNAIHAHAPARFNQIAASLPKASSSTLAETLHSLEAARLIDRRAETAMQAQPTYVLNPSGIRLLSRLRRLLGEIREP